MKEKIIVLLISALCLVPPIILPNARFLIYGGFILFEICVGLFWPAIGFMRGIYLPETGFLCGC
uniref:YqaE/Pmp3 family membrane protein n=1 Tax=Romanomermis culicivorax TaxID=13658 RepID=A0A915K8A9_ROMCU